MEREFSAALHPTQFGNHLEYKHNGGHRKMNPEVAKLVEQGYNVRKAYRMVAHAKAENKVKQEFDYEAETPKGEWV